MSEDAQKYTDAYNLFASFVGIDPKNYAAFRVEHDGDVLTIIPCVPCTRSDLRASDRGHLVIVVDREELTRQIVSNVTKQLRIKLGREN
jgi:hypothetical protein